MTSWLGLGIYLYISNRETSAIEQINFSIISWIFWFGRSDHHSDRLKYAEHRLRGRGIGNCAPPKYKTSALMPQAPKISE